MPSTKLIEKRKELEAKNATLHALFEEAGENMDFEKITSIEGSTKDKVETVRKMNKELEALGKEVDDLAEIERIASEAKARTAAAKAQAAGNVSPDVAPIGAAVHPIGAQAKSIGELFTETEAFKQFHKGHQRNVVSEIKLSKPELKTLMETSAGWAPESIRTGRVVEIATRPIFLLDALPTGETSQAAVVYMEETTLTNNAAEVAEGGTYGEAALVLTERSETVRKIGVWLPITDEQLEDVPQAQSYINMRLPFMLRQRLDGQVLTGDGVAPNLTGVLNKAGIQTQAKGADPVPDAVYKAMTLVRVTGRAFPSLVVMHPNDWQGVRLLRTVDGIYIWGSPSEAGPERLWGVTVIQTDAETENTALVGDFANFCQLVMRRDIEVKITDSHDDYFIKGKQAIRADVRVAYCIYRAAAFCSVTGI